MYLHLHIQPAVSLDQNFLKFLTAFRLKEACYSRVSFEEVYLLLFEKKCNSSCDRSSQLLSCDSLWQLLSVADRQQQLWPVPCAQPLSSAAVSWPLFMWGAASSLLEIPDHWDPDHNSVTGDTEVIVRAWAWHLTAANSDLRIAKDRQRLLRGCWV